MALSSKFIREYKASSLLNIYMAINNKVFGMAQTISFQIYREMAPIYTMGNKPTPKKRSVGGSLSGVEINKDVFSTIVPPDIYSEDRMFPFDIFLISNEENKEMAFYQAEVVNKGYGLSVKTFISSKDLNWITKEKMTIWQPCENNLDVYIEDHRGQIYNPYTDTWSWL